MPLIERGEDIEVTNSNKLQYLNLLAQYILAKCVREEIESFLKGDYILSFYKSCLFSLVQCIMSIACLNRFK